jgi:O-antigen/teichoic acid export membrane protein
VGYGLNNAVFRYVVLKEGADAKEGVVDYVIRRGTCFNIVLVLVVSTVAYYFPHSHEFSMATYMFPLMVVAIPLQFLFDTGTYSLRALFKNKAYAVFALATVLCIWLFKIVGASIFGIEGAVLSWPISYALMAIVVLLYLKKNAFKHAIAKPIERSEKHEIDKYSLQYMVTNGLWIMFLQNDLLLLGMLTGSSSFVASYKVAYAIPAAMSIVSNSIGMFVAPYFVKYETDKRWVWSNYLRVLAVSVVALGILTIILMVFADQIIVVLYGAQYSDSVDVMRLLLVAVFLSNAVRYTAANLLAAMGSIRANLVVSAIGIIIQIGLDILLIPSNGMEGAAIASIIVYTLMSVAITTVFVSLYKPIRGIR